MPAEAAYRGEVAIRRVLTEDEPVEVSRYRVYTFPERRERTSIADAKRLLIRKAALLDHCGPCAVVAPKEVFAIVENGHVLSYCRSTQPVTGAHPIAAMPDVHTLPERRRQGYASQVLWAWAHYHQQQGALLFFGQPADDEACAALAWSMDLQPCFAFVAFF
ncbi:MAG TPA: GNAT family N-acetyltransferase [Ktedonobacterales bacterium]|nr:GNAT family N-acetyltransferase [Ktedonobacterales bacterium]